MAAAIKTERPNPATYAGSRTSLSEIRNKKYPKLRKRLLSNRAGSSSFAPPGCPPLTTSPSSQVHARLRQTRNLRQQAKDATDKVRYDESRSGGNTRLLIQPTPSPRRRSPP